MSARPIADSGAAMASKGMTKQTGVRLGSAGHFHLVDLDQFATAHPKTIFLCGNQFRERDNVEKKNVDRVSSCYSCDTTC